MTICGDQIFSGFLPFFQACCQIPLVRSSGNLWALPRWIYLLSHLSGHFQSDPNISCKNMQWFHRYLGQHGTCRWAAPSSPPPWRGSLPTWRCHWWRSRAPPHPEGQLEQEDLEALGAGWFNKEQSYTFKSAQIKFQCCVNFSKTLLYLSKIKIEYLLFGFSHRWRWVVKYKRWDLPDARLE